MGRVFSTVKLTGANNFDIEVSEKCHKCLGTSKAAQNLL